MKIIHTADWHLGHILYGYDRASDHRQALASLTDHVARLQPDALVVSGDIFHTSQPSAAAMQLLAEALLDMRRAAPAMHIVLTAGNHDSPSRHEVFRLPWSVLNVTVVGRPPVDADDVERFIVNIRGKGLIVALPYMHPRFIPEGFYANLNAAIESLNTNGLPVAAMAHAAITGSDSKGHDDWSDGVIGSLATLDASEVAVDYDYLALGHIHHAQTLKHGTKAVRYSGSLIPCSFAEVYDHTVSLVEIEARGDSPRITKLPLSTGRRVINYGDASGMTPEAIINDFDDYVENLSSGDFVRVNVTLSTTEPVPAEMTQKVTNACAKFQVNLCGFNILRKEVARSAAAASLSADELQQLAPANLLSIYAAQRQLHLDDDMLELFNQIAQKEFVKSAEYED